MPRIEILNQEFYNSPFPKFCIKNCIVARDFPDDNLECLPEESWNELFDDVDKALMLVNNAHSFARRWLTGSCILFLVFVFLMIGSALFEKDKMDDMMPSWWTDYQRYVYYILMFLAIAIQIFVHFRTGYMNKKAFVDVAVVCEHHSTSYIQFSVGSEDRRFIKHCTHQKATFSKHCFILMRIDDGNRTIISSDIQYTDTNSHIYPISPPEEESKPTASSSFARRSTKDYITSPLRERSSGSLRNRLAELEGIKDLVTEEEYDSKRREILSQL